MEFFEVHEQSILDLQAAQTAGRVTSRGLVESYLARIQAYDQAGPRLNAIVLINPRAREEADALDRERAEKGPRGPLHGIPVLIKDNYDTADMPTSGGSLALATLQPSADAFQVRKLRDAGAVILGKTTMHELASGITNISSLTNQTRNPYDLYRTPGGSSGGTGAAIGASFAAAGMGSDTCGSIRIPAGQPESRRPARHARAVEPQRRDAAVVHAGHRRPAGAHRDRSRDHARRHRRRGSDGCDHQRKRRPHSQVVSRGAGRRRLEGRAHRRVALAVGHRAAKTTRSPASCARRWTA